MTFAAWRRVHRVSSGIVGVIALVHCAVTFVFYDHWSPNAVWFFGTGVGILTIAILNLAHIGVEPCRQYRSGDSVARLRVRWTWLGCVGGSA